MRPGSTYSRVIFDFSYFKNMNDIETNIQNDIVLVRIQRTWWSWTKASARPTCLCSPDSTNSSNVSLPSPSHLHLLWGPRGFHQGNPERSLHAVLPRKHVPIPSWQATHLRGPLPAGSDAAADGPPHRGAGQGENYRVLLQEQRGREHIHHQRSQEPGHLHQLLGPQQEEERLRATREVPWRFFCPLPLRQ